MDAERAELYWKWGVKASVALTVLLVNVLLLMVIANASDAFGAMDRLGEAAESLKQTSEAIDVLVADLGEDAERITSTLERVGGDVANVRVVLEQAGEDVTRATDALEDARSNFERAADDFGRIADTLEDAFAQ